MGSLKGMGSPERVFLGWDKPLLHLAVDWLAARYERDGIWDLQNQLLVLPGSLAGRRLLELLAQRSEERGWLLKPPEIVTSGILPEKLYQPKFAFASDLVQVLVWCDVLRSAPAAALGSWIFQLPDRGKMEEWIELATVVSRMHRELASDDLGFLEVASKVDHDVERRRWEGLAQLQQAYLARLDQLNLWDIQTARRVALHKSELSCDRQVVVLGAVDLNEIQQRYLSYIADQVTILIGAPETLARSFDEMGCLVAARWQQSEVPLTEEQILVAGGPADQADEVAAVLAELGDDYSVADVTLGVPDLTLIPFMRERLKQSNTSVRYGAGRSLLESMPGTFLFAVQEQLNSEQYSDWSQLIRHPVVERYLRNYPGIPERWLEEVDRYYNETLLRSLKERQFPKVRQAKVEVFQQVLTATDNLLAPLRSPSQKLSQWVDPLLQVLRMAFESWPIDEHDPNSRALYGASQQLTHIISEAWDIPPSLDIEVTGGEALRWLLRRVEGEMVAPPADWRAIEMLGWLELPLDDAPVLLLTGMTENCIPESVNADAFLPNRLRSKLGLVDNERRFARDVYSMHLLCRTRRHLRVIVGRFGVEGNPLLPSRLLMATSTDKIGLRVSHLLQTAPREESRYPEKRWNNRLEESDIGIPIADSARVPTHLAVTDFRYYLACPYRFYLQRVLKLETLDDRAVELNPARFGTLIHDCIDQLQDPLVSSCTIAEVIEGFLLERFDELVKDRFGTHLRTALKVQVEQARQRLCALAAQQALRAADGWEIVHTEIGVDRNDPVKFLVDGVPMNLIGRIDRVDRHKRTGQWAIWDYKTSDTGKLPFKQHYNASQKQWKDLQLPLYRHLVRKFGIEGDLIFGYINLPRDIANTRFEIADFSQQLLDDADLCAATVIRSIRAGIYGPPVYPSPQPNDPFAAICQEHIVRRAPWRGEDAQVLMERYAKTSQGGGN